jgi:hypothetical protein
MRFLPPSLRIMVTLGLLGLSATLGAQSTESSRRTDQQILAQVSEILRNEHAFDGMSLHRGLKNRVVTLNWCCEWAGG